MKIYVNISQECQSPEKSLMKEEAPNKFEMLCIISILYQY